MNNQQVNTTSPHNMSKTSKDLSLDELCEARYLELFGEDNLIEDIPLLKEVKIPTAEERINRIKMDTISLNLQYKKAMAAYQRDKEAEITRYNFCPDFDIPPSVRCCEKTPVNITTVINEPTIDASCPEEVIVVNIDPVEKMEIEGVTKNSQTTSNLTISNNKRKKEMWKNKRNLARKIKREQHQ